MKHIIQNCDEKSYLFVASHNYDSIEIAKEIMEQRNITDERVRFGQLKGFSDQITGMLAQQNYKVYKYLPFGPTETVMPYLIRRGQESK
jgi:proline dehydrogenase